ncbi:MAG: hypothetical protein IKV99_04695 [Oscillospiraceae bacterium]|nr:hypothetical protein [Oscillospiraceae bacterium]
MTRRLLTIRWSFYGATTLLILLLQSQVLGRISLWGVCPVVVACLAAVAATREPTVHAVIYAIVLGAVCDTLFVAALPCFYVLLCVIAAALSGVVSRRAVMPGILCSALCCAATLLISGVLSGLVMIYGDAPVNAVVGLLLREVLVSLPFALVMIHPVFSRIHQITTP